MRFRIIATSLLLIYWLLSMSSGETAAVFTDVHSSPNSVVATAPCFAGGGVYVWSQDFSSVPNGNKFKVSATFTVKRDSDSDCVAEVSDSPADLVNIDWTMHMDSNGSVSATDSGITDASGVFTTREFVRNADVYISSSSLTHGSLMWLSVLDIDNPLIVTVP